MKQTFILSHPGARKRAMACVAEAPPGMLVEVREVTRSNEASAKFHAMCTDFARSGVQWAGKRRTAEEWKVLLISGHAVATRLGAEVVPGLENEFCNIRESSARMSIARMNSLIEYAYAAGVRMGVRFTAPEYEPA